MSRELKKIILPISNYELSIIPYLTWGEKEDIQSVLLSGVNIKPSGIDGFSPQSMFEAKYKTFEVAIKKITLNGNEIPFSKEWLRELPASDGDFITEAIDKIDKKKE